MFQTYEKRREYQMDQLQRMISYAYAHTRYYRNLLDERGISPKSIQDFSDIKKIPILTKDIVQNHLAEMVSDAIPRQQLQYVTTGGSTGKPLGLYITATVERKRLAFTWLNWSLMGYRMGDACAVLRGTVVKDGFWSYDRGENYLILSTYDLRETNISEYLARIKDFSPKFLRAYPSVLDILARYIQKHGKMLSCLSSVKGIATSSEVLTPEQKVWLEDIFQIPIFDQYGNCEQVGFLGMCPHGHYYEAMEHSYLEYLTENGNDAVGGEVGEIIGTSFINDAVPFIRYKTGDEVLLSRHPLQCDCGIHTRSIQRIEGRMGESLQTHYGNLISITALNSHSDIFDHTARIQYYQDTPGIVVLKIVRRPEYTDQDTEKIYAELNQKFKQQVDLRIEFVEEIPLTSRGKYKYLDQRLKW
ncbi:hypothetical protein HMPREF1985_01949 [Mitsuokella sp. oral taxon 131 str. W9106]|nr:hypothetical protein HMPREF1985_01949 [Mitsuokella sp. oral taxon 131 str. W9106]